MILKSLQTYIINVSYDRSVTIVVIYYDHDKNNFWYIDVAYHIRANITVEPGETRSCGILSIPDNLCLDKDKEYQLYFRALNTPDNTTIIFQRNTSWLFIVDNDSK